MKTLDNPDATEIIHKEPIHVNEIYFELLIKLVAELVNNRELVGVYKKNPNRITQFISKNTSTKESPLVISREASERYYNDGKEIV